MNLDNPSQKDTEEMGPYKDYLRNISSKFENLFAEISAEANFDYGDEFEIALCKVLRILLPTKFGVCRGYAVTFDGKSAGDDIIIYDRERFPTLRLLENSDFSQKQLIPVEAVYAYFEVKHTLYMDGDGPQSLEKACQQVSAVKALTREKVPPSQVSPTMSLDPEIFRINPRPLWPEYLNPLYGAIIARNVACRPGATVSFGPADFSSNTAPDLAILGDDFLLCPLVKGKLESPFFVPGVTTDHGIVVVPGKAFGMGMLALCWALDVIELGTIRWARLIEAGFQSSTL